MIRPEETIARQELAPVRERLGEHLVGRGVVSQQAVDAALMEQKVTGDRLGMILVRNGFLTYKNLVAAILDLNSSRIASERVSRSRIPTHLLDQHSIILAAETEGSIFVSSMSDEHLVRGIVTQHYPDKEINFVSFVPDHMADFVERMEQTSDFGEGPVAEEDVLDKLLYQALAQGASDVHVIPRGRSYTVFFRMLGVRHLIYEGAYDEYLTVVAQVKDRARMDLAEKRIPQDGGFQIEHNGKLIDLRVATVPGVSGEIIVMRVLDPDRVQPRLNDLGITRVGHWRSGFGQRDGLCLVCGPTGSGKTTTLNASVRELDRFGKAIYSIEEPVEYQISYTGQISTNQAVGLGFAQAVRAFMRADPDVIILGEVRDAETARNAIRAAETGHLVLATLHTGSIIGALARLRDLDVPPHELRDLLRSVLVQTLVRTVCGVCNGDGCAECRDSGYAGRTIVSECASFPDGDAVDEVIAGKRTWPTLLEDAVKKWKDGITTEDEMWRVFGSAFDNVLDRQEGNNQ